MGKKEEERMSKREELKTIIEKNLVYPVFQPIVSLHTGEVHGYEALSRMVLPKKIKNTEELFSVALLYGKTWDLEKVCRKAYVRIYRKPSRPMSLAAMMKPIKKKGIWKEKTKKGNRKKYLLFP